YSFSGGPSMGFSEVTRFTFNGRGGNDTLNITYGSDDAQVYNLDANAITGSGIPIISYGTTETVNFTTGGGADTFNINANSASVRNIYSEAGTDRFMFADGVFLGAGSTIDGGHGADTLNYSAHATAVGVNLGLGTSGLSGTLEGDQVP